jgi:hypothetical protein
LPRKKIENTINAENVVSPPIPEERVWDTLEFAQSLGGLYPAVYSPQLVSQRMKDMTLLTVGEVTQERAEKALANPKDSEKELLAISEGLEYTSTSYRRIIDYLSNLPSWDWTYAAINVDDPNEFKSPAYKRDLKVLKEFFYHFNVKQELSQILKQLLREESAYYSFRDEGNQINSKFVMQQLPSDRCMITGRWEGGILFSFDYTFFLQGGVDIDMFSPAFKTGFLELFGKDGKIIDYIPSRSIDTRSQNQFAYFKDCSPEDGYWCFKFQPAVAQRIPYLSGLFPDLALQPTIRNLQKNNYMAEAVKLLMGKVDTLKDVKSASVRDQFNLSPELASRFLQLIKSAINNSAVSVASAPLSDMKAYQFEGNNELYESYMSNLLGMSGIGNVLFSGKQKANQSETYLSVDVDQHVLEHLYPMFEDFLEYQINKLTKKYKFKITLQGSNFYIDKERRLERQTTLSNMGIVLPQQISAALGMNVFEFQTQLDEARMSGWVDNLTPIISSFQQSGSNSQGTGRPRASDSDIGEAGSETRSAGSNIGKGGKEK